MAEIMLRGVGTDCVLAIDMQKQITRHCDVCGEAIGTDACAAHPTAEVVSVLSPIDQPLTYTVFGAGWAVDVTLPALAVAELTTSGDQTQTADYWAARIKRPRALTKARIVAELAEYGAWERSELAAQSTAELWSTLLWIVAGNLAEMR